jgi:hypothetical protein
MKNIFLTPFIIKVANIKEFKRIATSCYLSTMPNGFDIKNLEDIEDLMLYVYFVWDGYAMHMKDVHQTTESLIGSGYMSLDTFEEQLQVHYPLSLTVIIEQVEDIKLLSEDGLPLSSSLNRLLQNLRYLEDIWNTLDQPKQRVI